MPPLVSLPGQRLIDEQPTFADPSGPGADGFGILVFACAFRAAGGTGRSDSGCDLCHCGGGRDNDADVGAPGVSALRSVCDRGPHVGGLGGSLFAPSRGRFCLATGVRYAPRDGRVLSLLPEPVAALAAGRCSTVLHRPAFVYSLRRVVALFRAADVCRAGNRTL